MARRGLNKSHSPGKWGPAVEGIIEENESYVSNIIKESEEVGLKIFEKEIKKGPKFFIQQPYKNRFHQFFILDRDIRINKIKFARDEVESIKLISSRKLYDEVKKYPEKFVNSVKYYLGLKNEK